MTRPLFAGLIIIAVSLVPTAPAVADFPVHGQVYDTVDAVETRPNVITITGIVAGQSTATTSTYTVEQTFPGAEDSVARCDRMALLAMAKPGKFQFATIVVDNDTHFVCKLILRTP